MHPGHALARSGGRARGVGGSRLRLRGQVRAVCGSRVRCRHERRSVVLPLKEADQGVRRITNDRRAVRSRRICRRYKRRGVLLQTVTLATCTGGEPEGVDLEDVSVAGSAVQRSPFQHKHSMQCTQPQADLQHNLASRAAVAHLLHRCCVIAYAVACSLARLSVFLCPVLT